ncbi:MAG: DUF4124 domain-containing protein [Thiotrichales bacterium]|nr:MAG: DUF4124 domain-containing protein [Thiotrichales bacterium]
MKSTIISMMIVLCILAIIPTLLTGDRNLLSGFGLGALSGSSDAASPPKNLTNVTTDEKVQVYKWRDEHGVMQFTNTPPLDNRQVEIVELTPNMNIVKAIEVPEEEPEVSPSRPKVMTVGNPYTPEGMKDLLDTTSSLAEGMGQQQMEQQQLMNQMLGIQQKK